ALERLIDLAFKNDDALDPSPIFGPLTPGSFAGRFPLLCGTSQGLGDDHRRSRSVALCLAGQLTVQGLGQDDNSPDLCRRSPSLSVVVDHHGNSLDTEPRSKYRPRT